MRALILACAATFAVAALGATTASTATPPDWAQTGLKKAAGPAPYGVGVTSLVRSKSRLYAATSVGLFRSDGGVVWKSIQPAGLKQKIGDLTVDPSNPNRLWAAAWDWGVYRTADGGKTWAVSWPCSQKNAKGECVQKDLTSAVAVDPTNPSIVYAGARIRGVYKSTDGGDTWGVPAGGVTSDVYNAGIFMFDPTTIFVHPRKPNVVLAGIGGTGIFRSADGGKTFAKAMSGFSVKPVAETAAASLKTIGEFVYDPVTKNVLVGTKATVYRSGSDGASWTSSAKGMRVFGVGGHSGALQQSPVDPKLMVYVGSIAPGLWGSSDGGRSWKPLSTSGLCCSSGGQIGVVDAVVFDRGKPKAIYLGTNENGVYVTRNGAGILGKKK